MTDPRWTIDRLRDEHGIFSWEGQALQYDQLGDPDSIVYRRFYEKDSHSPVDTLLYYDERGLLAGVLNTYPLGGFQNDGTVLEDPGNVNTFSREDGQVGKTVREKLLTEARRRWRINEEVISELGVGRTGTKLATSDAGGHLIPAMGDDGNRRIWRPRTQNR